MPATDARSYYDSYWEREKWDTQLPPKLEELFTTYLRESDACVDVGCGDGGTAGSWLHEHLGSYVGVDLSESALRLARERGLDARLIDDATELPFDPDSFDVAVCTEVLEHVFDPEPVIGEINRVLRPGGRLVVTVPNAAHWRNRLDLAIFGRWNPRGDQFSPTRPWRDPHLRFFTLKSLVDLVELGGFTVLAQGGHAQYALSQHVPHLRDLARQTAAGRVTRALSERLPRVASETIYVVGQLD